MGLSAVGHDYLRRPSGLNHRLDPPWRAKYVARKCLPRLGLDYREPVAMLNDQVSFCAMAITIKKDTAMFSPVGSVLDDLRNDPGLKYRSAKWMAAKLAHLADSQQPAQQARVNLYRHHLLQEFFSIL